MHQPIIGNLFLEASVVGVVCLFFMTLMVVAGVKQIYKENP